MRGTSRIIWILAVVLTASLAEAADERVAQQAAEASADVVDRHCADVVAERVTEYAEALAAVTPVLAQVSRAYDASGAAYLLYWRGLLSACVGQVERSIIDLEAFLVGVGDDQAYTAQSREARIRLSRLRGEPAAGGQAPPAAAGVVAGGILLGAGGVLAGVSGWQGQLAQSWQAEFETGGRLWAESEVIAQDAATAATTSNALLAACVGSGVAGAVVVAVSAATGARQRSAAVVVPLPEGGLALHVGGQW